MEKLRSSKKGNFGLPAALLALTGLFFYGSLVVPFLAWGLSVLLFLILAMVIIHYHLQQYLAKTIAFLLPFSVYVPFAGSSMIRIPTEPLLMLAAVVLYLELPGRFLKKPDKPLQREYLWVLPLAAAFVLTIPFSGIKTVSLKFSFINLLYISVFFVFLSEQFTRNRRLFMQMILLYTMGMVVVMLWGVYRYWQWEWNPVVIRGVFLPFYNDHTIYGASAALVAALWFSTVSLAGNPFSRMMWLVPGLILTAGVVFSSSRAAFISLIVYFLIFGLLVLKFRIRHVLLISAGILLIIISFGDALIYRLKTIAPYDHTAGLVNRTLSAGNITTDMSNIERMNRWISAWRMFREKPLTGFGPGTYQFVYIPYQDQSLMNRLSVRDPWNIPEGSGGTAHSEYLLVLSEMGLTGLAGWLIILGRLFFIAFARSHYHPRRKIIIAAFAALATYIFHSHFNNFLNTDKFAFLFWGTAAWLVASYHSSIPENLAVHTSGGETG